jgi:hypothetical protein
MNVAELFGALSDARCGARVLVRIGNEAGSEEFFQISDNDKTADGDFIIVIGPKAEDMD